MARDILLNEINEMIKKMDECGDEPNVSIMDILIKVNNNRVTKFESNGGKVDCNSLGNIADKLISDLFEMPLEEVKLMSEKNKKDN